jgi:hypothetical protein
MVMYYPGSAEADMGPTAIVPSSHILARDGLGLSYGVMDDGPAGAEDRGDWCSLAAFYRPFPLIFRGSLTIKFCERCRGGLGGRAEILPKIAPALFEHKVVVPASEAGSVCIVHEDMVHRGTPRDDEDMFRPMFKWSFSRVHDRPGRQSHYHTTLYILLLIINTKYTGWCDNDFNVHAQLHEPSAPSWQHDPSAPSPPASDWPALVTPEAGAICESLWRWHKGEATAGLGAAEAAAVDTVALGAVVLAPPRDGDEQEC